MRPDPSERALRRLVAGLAKAGPADIEAVLEQLVPRERTQVEDLLASYRSGSRAAEKVTPITPGMSPLDGVSPWLARRIDAGREAERMTPTAVAALQAVATALRREGGAGRPRARSTESERPSLVGRMRRAVMPRGLG